MILLNGTLPTLSARDCKYIVHLYHLLHYRMAAEVLGIKQPTLSVAIRKAEEKLGDKLFVKSADNRSRVVPSAYLESIIWALEGVCRALDRLEIDIMEVEARKGLKDGWIKN